MIILLVEHWVNLSNTIQTVSALRTNSPTEFNPKDPANAVCVRHVWRSAHMTWNVPAYQQIFIELANSTAIEYPAAPPLKLRHNASGRVAKSPSELEQFLFVLKVNKIGQQCKYFYSRKWSQTHRCIAEAERGGNMVLASEKACAVFQPSRSFKFNLLVCRQMHAG